MKPKAERRKKWREKNGSAGQLWCQSERMWAMWAANKSHKTEMRRHKECSKNKDERQEVSNRWWKCHCKELKYWMRMNVSVYVSLYLLNSMLTRRVGGVPWGQIYSVPLPLSAAFFMCILHVAHTAVGSVNHHSVSTCVPDRVRGLHRELKWHYQTALNWGWQTTEATGLALNESIYM